MILTHGANNLERGGIETIYSTDSNDGSLVVDSNSNNTVATNGTDKDAP